jgi:hypothetical protein
MTTVRWLAVIVALAAMLALGRWAFGDSLAAFALFFIAATVMFEYVRGSRQWLRAVLGGLAATAFYAVLSRFVLP